MRLKARKDSNHNEIQDVFKAHGFSIVDTSSFGRGFVDFVAGRHNKNYLVEVKDINQPPSKRKLTPDEERFHKTWAGQVCVLESVEQTINFINDIE